SRPLPHRLDVDDDECARILFGLIDDLTALIRTTAHDVWCRFGKPFLSTLSPMILDAVGTHYERGKSGSPKLFKHAKCTQGLNGLTVNPCPSRPRAEHRLRALETGHQPLGTDRASFGHHLLPEPNARARALFTLIDADIVMTYVIRLRTEHYQVTSIVVLLVAIFMMHYFTWK